MRNHTRGAQGWLAPLRMLPILAFIPFVGCDWLGITEAPTPDTVLEIAAAPATAPADSASTVLITVQVDTTASPAITEVTFATTLGTFAGGTATITAPVDAEGRALAQLKAPAAAGTAIVTATAAGQTRTVQVTFTTPVNGFTSVSASPPTAPADGASTTVVTAQVNLAAVPAVRDVKFATTLGTFPGNVTSVTVPVDASGTAQVQLRAPADTGTAIVTATAGGATRTTVVGFVPAPPTRLELTSDSFVLPAGLAHSVNLTATPLRSVGTPSPGTIVTFSADTVGGSGGGFGQFSASSVLVRSGSATSRFSAGETSYRGPVMIRATATQAGQSVSDSTIVTITSPP
jgi:hypothetical protein